RHPGRLARPSRVRLPVPVSDRGSRTVGAIPLARAPGYTSRDMAAMPPPFLCFDFQDAAGAPERLCFQDPVEVVSAHRLDEVMPALRTVQSRVEQGLYAAGYLAYEAAPAFD